MDSKFDSNSSGLIELSSTIGIHKGRMNEMVFKIKDYVKDLQQEWKSLDADRYVERYNELCSMIAVVVDSISNVEVTLVEVADSLSEVEHDLIININNGEVNNNEYTCK